MLPILKALLLALVLTAAAYDLRFRRIPNWLALSGFVAGLGANIALLGWRGLFTALLGSLVALAVYLPLYLIRGMGAGDVKLMIAVGAIVGPRHWLGIFLATAVAGGLLSLLLIAWKKRFYRTFLNLSVIGVELLHFRAPSRADERLDIQNPQALRLPYGAVIACGSIAFLAFFASN